MSDKLTMTIEESNHSNAWSAAAERNECLQGVAFLAEQEAARLYVADNPAADVVKKLAKIYRDMQKKASADLQEFINESRKSK